MTPTLAAEELRAIARSRLLKAEVSESATGRRNNDERDLALRLRKIAAQLAGGDVDNCCPDCGEKMWKVRLVPNGAPVRLCAACHPHTASKAEIVTNPFEECGT